MLNKYHNMPLPIKAAFWFTICNLILKGISFITVPIFTRLMSDVEYGKLSLFLSYEQLLVILATWEIQMGAYQKGLFKYKNEENIFTISTQAIVNILSVIFFFIIFIFNDYVIKFTGMSRMVLAFLMMYILFQPAYNCWLIRKRTSYSYKSSVIVTLLYAIINVAVPMTALLLVKRTAEVKFVSTLICSTIFCIIFYLPYAKYWKIFLYWKRVKEYWLFLVKFEAPLVLHSLSYLILSQADRVMIGKMVGEAEAAYYSVAYSIGSVVSILQNSINQTLIPWMYQMLEKKKYNKIGNIINYILMGISSIMLMFILVAPDIIMLLFEKNYYEAIWCIPPIVMGVYFMFLYSVFVNVETFFEKTKYVMYVSVACGLINIVLNYICIKIWGYIACGYTTMICYIIFAIGHYYFMRKTVKAEGIKENIFNYKSIFLISLGTVLLGVLFTVLYNYRLARWAILGIILLCLFGMRNKIRYLMNILKNN